MFVIWDLFLVVGKVILDFFHIALQLKCNLIYERAPSHL